LVISVLPAHSQVDPDSLFPAELLREDLDMLRTTIIKTHVDPFVFCSEESFNSAFEVASEQVSGGMTAKAFTPVVSSVLQVMRDSHTCLNYPYFEDQLLDFGGRKLMFHAVSTGEGFYVEEDILQELEPGSKLVSINDVGIEQLHNRMLVYSSIEGNSIVGYNRIADALIGPLGGMEVEVFKNNKIKVIPPGSDSVITINYPGLKKKEIKIFYKLWLDYHGMKARERIYDLNFLEDPDVAVLKVGSFSEESGRSYSSFLKKSFEEIQGRGVDQLVIDIRNNTGGQSIRMEELLAYICEVRPSVPHNIIARQSPLARERVEKIYRGFNKFAIDHFFGKNEEVLAFRTMMQLKDGEQDTLYFKNPQKVDENLQYSGRCYLLMNGMSASASVNFAGAFRKLNRGMIIGESCLGPMSGTFGNPSVYKLKNTGIEVMISTIRFNSDGTFEYETEPIQPDYEVPVSPDDLSKKIDSQVEYVREMIRQ
jgi:C-terminal processing protease CtpA/Prc